MSLHMKQSQVLSRLVAKVHRQKKTHQTCAYDAHDSCTWRCINDLLQIFQSHFSEHILHILILSFFPILFYEREQKLENVR